MARARKASASASASAATGAGTRTAVEYAARAEPDDATGAGAASAFDSQASDAAACEPGGRQAVGVDGELQRAALARLSRIEGQVRGIRRMVDEGRYCADILTQVSAVHEALRGVGKLLMRNHLEHCVAHSLRTGDALEAERTYEEILRLMYTHAR